MASSRVLAGVLLVVVGIALACSSAVSFARRHRSEDSGSSWDTWVRMFTNPSFPPSRRSRTVSTLIILTTFVVGFGWIVAGIAVLLGSS